MSFRTRWRNTSQHISLWRWLLRLSMVALVVFSVVACSSDGSLDDVGGDTGGDGSGTPGGDGGAPGGGGGGNPSVSATNIDIVVVRLNADGTVDPSFGEDGVQQLDFSVDVDGVGDTVWGVDRDALGRVLVFGATKGAAPRVDRDRVVVRLTANGAVDTSFATEGVYTLNIANLNENARNGQVLPDGKILAAGYTSQPTGVGTQAANSVVLLRLNSDGTPDTTFGAGGVVNENPLKSAQPETIPWGFVEAYAARPQSSGAYVTTGYGRPGESGTLDMIALRFTPEGVLDPLWGNAGVVQFDIAGENERGRNLLVLPDDRVVVVGLTTPVSPSTDALVVFLSANGALDASFNGTGWRSYDFGGSDEQFYGVALAPSGNWVAAVGYTSKGVDGDEDAILLVLPLAGGTEFAQVVPLATGADDRFWSVAFDAQDRIYAAGFATTNGDSSMVVARYTTAGALDPSFGNGGIATVNVQVAGIAETVRGIVLQADGKIILAGTAEGIEREEEIPAATNINIAAARLNADGTVDPSFGEAGIRQLDLSLNVGNAGDSAWGIDRDAQNRLLVFGGTRGTGTRADTDRVVVRLDANGAVDTSFATEGVYTLNIANLNDNARNGQVLADGKILAAGYTSQPTGVGTQAANSVVLLRLNSDGTPDTTFGVGGVENHNPFVPDEPFMTLWGFVEAYAARPQSSGAYVTTGYGRPGGTGTLDMIALRFTANGTPDPTWGAAGVVQFDVAGENERGRNLLVLPDDRVVVVGLTTPVNPSTDALVVLLTANGALDLSFNGTGWRSYDFGGADEQFYGVALAPSGNWVAAVGYSGNGVDGDEDAVLLVLPLAAGGTEVALKVPLSVGADDRFWSVAFDAQDRIYAAGFATENGDSRMAVARFNTAGVLDPSFGTGGVATLNVLAAGTAETVRGITLQTDGKILIAGTAEAAAAQ